MRGIIKTIISFSLTALGTVQAKPLSYEEGSGVAMPLTKHSSANSVANRNMSANLAAMTSHAASVRNKILYGLDNYERNTGKIHPLAVKRNQSGLVKRGAALPLTIYRDEFWVGKISVGTPPKTFNVEVDTGSADLWLLKTGCGPTCGDRNLWNPGSSDTAKSQDAPFQIRYSDEALVSGDKYTDNVTIAGFTADPQTIGAATTYSSVLRNNIFPVDGMLGMGFPPLSKYPASPLFESLSNQKKVINPTFSFKFTASGAELYIGGANSRLYNGAITYTRVTNAAFWQVEMNDIRLGGEAILKDMTVIFDTGANYIFGDWDRVEKLYNRLGGSLVEHGGFGYYYLPCESFPTLSLTFSGKSFEISPKALKLDPIYDKAPDCFSGIIAERKPIAFWTIGLLFLQNVYSVFDYSTSQVGFAELA